MALAASVMIRSGPALTVGAAFVAAALTITVTVSLALKTLSDAVSSQNVGSGCAEAGARHRRRWSGKDHRARSTDSGPPQGHGAGR